MPVMDGLEATRQIRAREREADERRLPIWALTANALSSDRHRCLDAGMDALMTKPLRLEELSERLARLERATASRPARS